MEFYECSHIISYLCLGEDLKKKLEQREVGKYIEKTLGRYLVAKIQRTFIETDYSALLSEF